jgi:hypothetical protein
LLLPAGQLMRVLLGLIRDAHHVEQFRGPAPPVSSGQLSHPQPEGDVVQRGHVREQAVALEHHAHVSLGGRNRRHVTSVHQHRPGVGGLEAGHDAQRGRLAVARRPEQRHELAGCDLQRQPSSARTAPNDRDSPSSTTLARPSAVPAPTAEPKLLEAAVLVVIRLLLAGNREQVDLASGTAPRPAADGHDHQQEHPGHEQREQ